MPLNSSHDAAKECLCVKLGHCSAEPLQCCGLDYSHTFSKAVINSGLKVLLLLIEQFKRGMNRKGGPCAQGTKITLPMGLQPSQ